MKFEFEKITDYNLIAPAIAVINIENNKVISTSKLIKNLRLISIVPEKEKEILKNRSDDKFSQKIRNLISHKVLENYHLAKSTRNQIELTNHGRRLARCISDKLIGQNLINIIKLINNKEYKKNLLMARLNINFNPILFERLENCEFSVRASNIFKELNLKHIGDLVNNITQKEILKSQNAGKKTSQEIENFLDKKELRLEMRTNWNTLDNKSYLLKEYIKSQTKDIDFNLDNIVADNLIKKNNETESQFLRKKKIISNRFGLYGEFSTLESLGIEYKISRERVRQIQKKFSDQIKNKENLKLGINKLNKFISEQTPILDSVLSDLLIKENFFNTSKDISILRSIISSFTKFKFDNYPIQNSLYKRGDDEISKSTYEQEFIVSSKKEEKLINLISVTSRKYTTKNSFCNFNQLINSLFKSNNFSKYLNIKNSFKLHENFLWFDDENFIALDTGAQTVLTRLKKILFIQEKISFDDFVAALLNDQRIETAPPIVLLKKICKLNNLRFDQDYIYSSGEVMQIADLDKKIIKLFKENGSYLTFWQCYDLSEKYDIKSGSLAKMLYSSYLVKKLDNKIFCLFGTEIDNEKIISAGIRAKKETKLNSDVQIDINWTKEKKVLVQFKLTKIIKLQGFIYITNGTWDKILEGDYYNNEINNYIKVKNAIWNIKNFLEKFDKGSQINIEFSFNPNTVKIF